MIFTDDTATPTTAIADAMRAASDRRLAAMRDALPIPMTPRSRPARRRTHSRRHRAISSRS